MRPYFSRPLVWLGARTLPYLIYAYMLLVWRTSRVEVNDVALAREIAVKYDGFVSLGLHQDLLLLGYGPPRFGVVLHTLASVGDAGEIITRALELAGCVVFRGGSASRESRRRFGVLRSMVRHMREGGRVVYGITVDGSKGPIYEVKDGAIAIARACDRPVVITRIRSNRNIRLRTWDRTAIPLPFGRIDVRVLGPFFPPAASQGEAAAERFRLECERDLIELAGSSHDRFGERRPSELLEAAQRNRAALEATR